MHYVLEYEIAPDYLERREPHRAEHLALGRAAAARGELVLAGAFDPADGALLLFQGTGPETAEAFARADPYVVNGLVTSWRVRRWKTVVGTDAATRVDGVGAPPRNDAEATVENVAAFLRTARFWTAATVGEDGAPQSAVIGVAVGDDLSLVFDTLGTTRKATNLRRDPRVSLAMWSGAATAQIEGMAEEAAGPGLDEVQVIYFATFADGRERAAWPDITYWRVRPRWIRVSDFGGDSPTVVEVRS